MPLYDYNGATKTEIGKLYDYDGATMRELSHLYDHNGATQSEIFSSEVTVTDLVDWNAWQVVNQPARFEAQTERWPQDNWQYTGALLYGQSPGVGYTYDTRIRQSISLIPGHQYWIHTFMSGVGDERGSGATEITGAIYKLWSTPSWDIGVDESGIFTAGSAQIQIDAWYIAGTARVRLWQYDVIDVTAAFGSTYTAAQMKSYCDLQCKGRSGTYTINT